MRIFFDTNILYDIAVVEDENHPSVKAMETCLEKDAKIYFAWHSASNLIYLLTKKIGYKKAVEFLKITTKNCKVATVGSQDLENAFDYDEGDFEDAMQITSALACNADYILTRDKKKGFGKSPIPVVYYENFKID